MSHLLILKPRKAQLCYGNCTFHLSAQFFQVYRNCNNLLPPYSVAPFPPVSQSKNGMGNVVILTGKGNTRYSGSLQQSPLFHPHSVAVVLTSTGFPRPDAFPCFVVILHGHCTCWASEREVISYNNRALSDGHL